MTVSTTTEPILKRIEDLTERIEDVTTLRRERAELMREALRTETRSDVARAAHMSRHGVSDAVARLDA
jgi:hypothetical protein